MNYLAHFHLVSPSTDLMIGGLLGDFVKGPLKGDYAKGIEQGIALHRRIDAFTDTDSAVNQLMVSLPKPYRRYGGIMLDMCFDHCLASHWQAFSQQTLEAFVQNTEHLLDKHMADMPAKAQAQARRLIGHQLLTGLRDWPLVERILAGIGSRLSRENPLAACGPWLHEQQHEIQEVFFDFYPRLQNMTQHEVSLILCD